MPHDPEVSIVIPVWNAASYLPTLLPALLAQEKVSIQEILLLDSNSSDNTTKIGEKFSKVLIIPEAHFSHGGTRNRGIERAATEYVVLMTQDAFPQNELCIRKLVDALQDKDVAYAFSRQLPYPKTNPIECYYLEQSFPSTSRRFSSGGNPVRTPEQTLSSNVCSALQKQVWRLYPFREDLIMGEDQQFSKDLQEAGYSVAYVCDSVVQHSHNYSLVQTFKRFFDSVVAMNEILPSQGISESSLTGLDYIKRELGYLAKNYPLWIPYYSLHFGVKAAATLLAAHEKHLPNWICRSFSMNKSYWNA